MKTSTNNTNRNAKASFEEMLHKAFGLIEKKAHMQMVVLEAVEHIHEQLHKKFDIVLDTKLNIIECPCPKKCGSIKVSVIFTAMTFTPEGIGMHEGEMSGIIMPKK
ncbi:hypothetical protein [Paenibacillus sp. Mc5Re-14]|uniref:hypothetical protein n=1 Tax=Paenibacillus sp. Mc5Re-14 TaxID=1030529 RepID=UPI000AA94E6A|nr:hypothetical protein [Paenibacillus sp. Mc5Re-14]